MNKSAFSSEKTNLLMQQRMKYNISSDSYSSDLICLVQHITRDNSAQHILLEA
jgi:hypothetical protein